MNYATYTSEKSFTSVVSLSDGRAADSSARVVGMQVRFGLLLAVFLLRFSLISSAPFLAVLSSRTASNSSFNSSTKQRYMNVYQRYTLRSSTCENLSKAELWSWFSTKPSFGKMIVHHLLPYTYYCKHVYITVNYLFVNSFMEHFRYEKFVLNISFKRHTFYDFRQIHCLETLTPLRTPNNDSGLQISCS